MLNKEFIKLAKTNFSALGRVTKNDMPKIFTPSGTIKNLIIKSGLGKEIEIQTDKTIRIVVKSGDYVEALFTDLHFSKIRIDQQREILGNLLASNNHPAWVLVTTYYASFFMVIELSKIAGKFMVNIDEKSLDELIGQSDNSEINMVIEKYNTFSVATKPGYLTGETILDLRKHLPRPHAIAWENFRSLFSSLNTDKKFCILISEILGQKHGWALPSEVRNEWNYSNPKYFGAHGLATGKDFIAVVKSGTTALKWANKNTLRASEENVAASIGFLYHILSNAYDCVISEFNVA